MTTEKFTKQNQVEIKAFILSILKEHDFTYNVCLDMDLDDIGEVYCKGKGTFLILKENNAIIGTIAVKDHHGGLAILKRFYIDRKFRGKGYGSRLLDKIICYCVRSGFTTIELDTWDRFKVALQMYKKRDFQEIRRDGEQIFLQKYLPKHDETF